MHRENEKGFTLFLPFPVGHAEDLHPFAIFAITGQRYS